MLLASVLNRSSQLAAGLSPGAGGGGLGTSLDATASAGPISMTTGAQQHASEAWHSGSCLPQLRCTARLAGGLSQAIKGGLCSLLRLAAAAWGTGGREGSAGCC